MMHRKRVIVAWLGVQLVGFSAAAHAYLDPGTGSILVQSLLAGIAGAAAVVSLYWQRLKAFFSNMRKTSHDDTRNRAATPDNDA